jgi:hypothetical protein
VIGFGEEISHSVRVLGTATGCEKVEVSVSCLTQEARSTVASVSASGAWEATINEVRALECLCVKRVSVVARCVEHPNCVAELAGELRCEGPGNIIK